MEILYKINPKSPFYAYMQDKSIEQSLSDDEKEQRKQEAVNMFAIWGLEGMEFTLDEQNYLIYALINDIDPNVAFNTLMENSYVNNG